MPGVPKELIEHALKVDPNATPKKQWLRRFSPDKREAIKKELAKLLATGFIKEVYHPEWLTNPVLVQKKNNNEWRMCIDYTDLNKHCPKDPFGLPRINQVIDSTAGYPIILSRLLFGVPSNRPERIQTESPRNSSPFFPVRGSGSPPSTTRAPRHGRHQVVTTLAPACGRMRNNVQRG